MLPHRPIIAERSTTILHPKRARCGKSEANENMLVPCRSVAETESPGVSAVRTARSFTRLALHRRAFSRKAPRSPSPPTVHRGISSRAPVGLRFKATVANTRLHLTRQVHARSVTLFHPQGIFNNLVFLHLFTSQPGVSWLSSLVPRSPNPTCPGAACLLVLAKRPPVFLLFPQQK